MAALDSRRSGEWYARVLMVRQDIAVSRRHILVVDDERYIVELLADLLDEEGYNVSKAYTGDTGLATAIRESPDLVVADVMMPGLDGFALAARLRERHIPVILMSAAVSRPEDSGVHFIAKPFDIDQLLQAVARLLDAG